MGKHNQSGIRAAHDRKLRCNNIEYTTAFLHSDWLYLLWHGIKKVSWCFIEKILSKMSSHSVAIDSCSASCITWAPCVRGCSGAAENNPKFRMFPNFLTTGIKRELAAFWKTNSRIKAFYFSQVFSNNRRVFKWAERNCTAFGFAIFMSVRI